MTITNRLSIQAQSWLRFSPWLFMLGLLFWWSSFSYLGLSIDQEYAILREDQRIWLSQGRWFVYLFTQYVYPQPVLMYFPHLMYVLCMVLSYILILRAFAVSFTHRWLALLAFPAFMAHPVWYFIAEFAANLVPTALGMVAIAIAVWLFTRPQNWKNITLQLLLLCVALGSYQSLIFLAYVLYAGRLLQQYSTKNTAPSLKPILSMALIFAGSLLLNAFLLKLLYALFQTPPSYVGEHIYLKLWLEQPLNTLFFYTKNLLLYYGGSSEFYQSQFFASGLVLVWAVVLFFWQTRTKPGSLRLLLGLLVLSLFIVPLIPQILLPYLLVAGRTLLGIAMVLWLASLYVMLHLRNSRYQWLAIAVVLLMQLQMLHLHARYDSAKQLLFQHDAQVALQLYERILQLIPDYNPQASYPLLVHGGIDYTPVYGEMNTSLVNGSFFQWDNGNPRRVADYMRTQNYHGLKALGQADLEKQLPVFATMPVWPQQGAVIYHNGIIMVKFND